MSKLYKVSFGSKSFLIGWFSHSSHWYNRFYIKIKK